MNSNMEKPYVVGIDIGGTNTVFGIVDARGTIIASSSIKTGAYEDVNDYVDEVCKNLLPLIIANGGVDKIKGIGIGAPNGNYYSGTIEFAPNLPWKGVIPLAAMFEERLGIPTALTNDANAAGIGEMTYGAARGMKDFIMITLGTGVGSGIVINGQMVYGHDGFAGELGHTIIRRENGRLCGCGRHGCLETYCSVNALKTAVGMPVKDFFNLLHQTQAPNLLQIWREYLDSLAFAIRNLNLVIDSTVIISGYLAPYFQETDMQYLLNKINESSLFQMTRDQLLVGNHGQYTPAIGAALHYIKAFLTPDVS